MLMTEFNDFANLIIESAESSDIEILTKITTSAYNSLSRKYLNKELGPPGYNLPRAHMDWLIRGDYRKIVYESKIIGGLILEDFRDMLFLGMIFIDVPYQQKGIGTYVMKYIEDSAKSDIIELNTPEWAIHNQKFFEKLGYEKVDSTFDSVLGFYLYFYQKLVQN